MAERIRYCLAVKTGSKLAAMKASSMLRSAELAYDKVPMADGLAEALGHDVMLVDPATHREYRGLRSIERFLKRYGK